MNAVDAQTLDHQQLSKILPHAFPFLLIDRVIDYKKGEYLIAEKLVTSNEWAFGESNHSISCFPETLLIEAAAQAALVLYRATRSSDDHKNSLFVLGKIKSEFFQSVTAGDQIQLHVSVGKMIATGGYSDVKVRRGNEEIASLELFYSVRPNSI